MRKVITSKIKFYYRPIIIALLINFLSVFYFGTFYEDYEGCLSSLVHGTYTLPATKEWYVDIQFLLFSLYGFINSLFPSIQVYGLVLVISNFIALCVAGSVFYRVLIINLKKFNIIFFTLCYFIFSVDNILNLSSTRISLILIFSVLAFVESRRVENKKIGIGMWCILAVLLFIAYLFRVEVLFLSATIYLFVLLIFKKIHRFSLILFAISFIGFFGYNFLVTNIVDEPKLVCFYKEKEFFDRNSIDYSHLTERQALDVKAFREYGITDKEHFTWKFYNDIAIKNSDNIIGWKSLLRGIKISAFLQTLQLSYYAIYSARYFIFFFIIASINLLIFSRSRIIHIFYIVFSILFPLLICFNTVLAERFLVPYFSALGCLSLCLSIAEKNGKYITEMTICAFLFILLFANTKIDMNDYLKANDKYQKSIVKLNSMIGENMYNNPIVICDFNLEKFFPFNPLEQSKIQNAVFLNFYYFSISSCYIERWNQLHVKNSYSLKEKIDYIVSNNNKIIIDERTFNFLEEYYLIKYKTGLQKVNVVSFDNELVVCNLCYR